MKITKRELKQMINESVYDALNESNTQIDEMKILNRINELEAFCQKKEIWSDIDNFAMKKHPQWTQTISKRLTSAIYELKKMFSYYVMSNMKFSNE